MTKEEMVILVKQNLNIKDEVRDLTISDVITKVAVYCNLSFRNLPEELEPFVRKKVQTIISYEEANGTGYQKEIASIKEGDGAITYVTGSDSSDAAIYGLSATDKNYLKAFRRLRGYA